MTRAKWIAAFLIVSVPVLGCNQNHSTAPSSEPPRVDVSTPVAEPISNYKVFTGRTQALNYNDVRARVTGYLKEAYFKEGQDVEEGKVLFLIDPRPYDAALNQAKANFDLQKEQLTYNEKAYDRLVDLSRNQGAVSQDDLDKARAARDTSQSSVKAADAAVKTAQLNVDFTKVLAPFSGRISRRQVDPGSLIQADNTILASLVQMDPMYAYFDVDERTLLEIRHLLPEGMVPPDAAAKLPVTLGFANEKPELFDHPGTLKFADNKVDPTTGTLRMWGIFENPKRDLFSGLFIRVRMEIPVHDPAEAEQWKFVAEAALTSEQVRKFLYVLKKETKDDGTPHDVISRIDVEVGQSKNGLIAVKGLKGDERVVVNNLQRVRPKMEIPADKQNLVPMPRANVPSTKTPVAAMPGSG